MRRLGLRRKHRMPDIGVREIAVLELLWSDGPLAAQDVHDRMSGDRVSLSTIQSTLERLSRKGLATRCKSGRAYRYAASLGRSELIAAMLKDLADEMAGGDLAPMVSGFMEYVAIEAPEIEADLAQVLQPGKLRK
jgi:predicted transcriptional regulator